MFPVSHGILPNLFLIVLCVTYGLCKEKNPHILNIATASREISTVVTCLESRFKIHGHDLDVIKMLYIYTRFSVAPIPIILYGFPRNGNLI